MTPDAKRRPLLRGAAHTTVSPTKGHRIAFRGRAAVEVARWQLRCWRILEGFAEQRLRQAYDHLVAREARSAGSGGQAAGSSRGAG